MIGDAPRSIRTGVPGWHTNQEEDFLVQMTQDMPDGATIVCVGVEYGRCASEIAWATRNKTSMDIHAVDLFPHDHHMGNLLGIFKANLKEAGFEGKVRAWQGDSAAIGKEFPYPVEMLFIDAGHHYAEVKADIAAWVPKVVEGGLIIFHDYAKSPASHEQHFEVKQAVDETFPDVLDGPDSIVYVYKGMEVEVVDSLTLIDGIGPGYAEKLESIEITTFKELFEADPDEIATALGGRVNAKMVQGWQSQAQDYL